MGTEHLLAYMQEGQVGVFLNQDFCSLYTTDVPVLHSFKTGELILHLWSLETCKTA